jgi:prepilin signal peptidase PulO-like enzyme (type II secretory pathway)
MDSSLVIFVFIFGIIIGSFLNVVSLRFNTGVGLNGRSKCMSCGKKLSWHELIPVLSFILQKGTCRGCKSKISWQYPLVEFISGVIFALIFIKFTPTSALVAFTMFVFLVSTGILMVATVYDIKHKIIPDQLSYTFAGLSLINLFIGGTSWLHMPSWSALLAGPILALPFALLWYFSKGNMMGLGDAKLVLGIGWFLGLSAGVNALVLAFWIGAAISLIWLWFAHGKVKMKTEIPFGPYLIIGMYIVFLFNIQVIDLHFLKLILMSYL